jgi:hypothetical protein
MTADALDPTLARHLIDDAPDEYVDRLTFGGPFVTVTFVEDVGVVLYSNGTDHSEAYHGSPSHVVAKAAELAQAEAEHLLRHETWDLVEYDESHEPVFKLSNEQITATEHYE